MSKYLYNEIKEKLLETVCNGYEPEVTLYLYGKCYMIIGYKDRVSFQRCKSENISGSGELFYDSINELYNTETVDNILLSRDWKDIEDFECFDFELFYQCKF